MANNLGSLVVSLGLDAAEFTKGLTKSQYEAEKFSRDLSKSIESAGKFLAGLGIGAAVVQSIRSTADYADEMGKLAQRAGTTTEAISGLSYAAGLSDVGNQTLARGLREIGNEATTGGEKLKALGIGLKDAAGNAKSSDALFLDLADKIAGIEDPQKRAAAASKLFGDRLGGELMPLLVSGRQGIKDMTDEAARFGRVVSDEAGRTAAEFNDNLTRLSDSASGVARNLAGPVITSLARTSSYFLKVSEDVGAAEAAFVTFGAAVARTLGVDDVGKLQSEAKAQQNAIALTVKQIETYQKMADNGIAGAGDRVAALREQYNRLQSDGARVSASLKGQAKEIEDAFAVKPGKGPGTNVDDLFDPPPKPFKDPYAEAKRYMETLDRQLMATEQLTVYETALREIQTVRLGATTTKQRESILNTAAEIDASREFLEIGKQFDALEKERLARQKLLTDQGRQMYEATRTPAEQLSAEIENINRLLAVNAISWDTAARAQFDAQDKFDAALKKTNEQIKQGKSFADELGLSFSSAFEDAVVGGEKFSDVLKGLADDVVRLIVRSQVTKPLADAFGGIDWGSMISGIFGGARASGGPVSGGRTYLVGERGPELFTPAGGGRITPNHALGGGGVTVRVVNESGNQVQAASASQSTAPDGSALIEIVLAAAGDAVANRSGPLARGLEAGYGLRPAMY